MDCGLHLNCLFYNRIWAGVQEEEGPELGKCLRYLGFQETPGDPSILLKLKNYKLELVDMYFSDSHVALP